MEKNICAKAESQDKAERQNKAEGQDKGMEYPAGIKWTRQRKSVYEVLKAAEEPFSAVQIYQHILQQERNIVRVFPQGREVKRGDAEPVVQIQPKRPFFDQPSKILVGR